MLDLLDRPRRRIEQGMFCRVTGRVTEVVGLTMVAEGFSLPVGSMCRIDNSHGSPLTAQLVGVRGGKALLLPLMDCQGIAPGDPVTSISSLQQVPVGRHMLGAVLDGLGRPIGGQTAFNVEDHYPVFTTAPEALSRQPIGQPLPTGIRCIDALQSLGKGQRLGVFAGTGVGKSVLMGMIARFSAADVIVVALIGERGREVGDFLRRDLGDEGMKRSVVVVSTSDQSPVLRVRAGFTATAVAEFFRDQGADVLLMMDSTTRIAMAQRQIGLAAGEPPTTKGYPPSVFDLLPKLLERSGCTAQGSITGLYNVLVEGDDLTEPVSDAVRGILDGHLWLSRGLANRGHFPAISPLESISRVMNDVVDSEHRQAAVELRRLIAVWTDHEDLINVGAYAPGANRELDIAVRLKPAIDEFLIQATEHASDWEQTRSRLLALVGAINAARRESSETPADRRQA